MHERRIALAGRTIKTQEARSPPNVDRMPGLGAHVAHIADWHRPSMGRKAAMDGSWMRNELERVN